MSVPQLAGHCVEISRSSARFSAIPHWREIFLLLQGENERFCYFTRKIEKRYEIVTISYLQQETV